MTSLLHFISSTRWQLQARPKQLPPEGNDWFVWLIRSGRGFGKTKSITEWLDSRARLKSPGSQVLLAGRTPSDVRDYTLQGPGGLLTSHPDVEYFPSKRLLLWPNGVEGLIRSGANPEEFRGFSGDTAILDEFCFAGDTLVETEFGSRPISQITTGDLVWTRDGLKKVIRSGLTGCRPVYKMTTESGVTLTGTANHPILCDGSWTNLSDLPIGGLLQTWQHTSNGTDLDGTGGRIIGKDVKANSSIERFGLLLMVRYPKDITCTILTMTREIGDWRIFNWSRSPSTYVCTSHVVLSSGIRSRGAMPLQNNGSPENQRHHSSVSIAETRTSLQDREIGSALGHVKQLREDNPELTTKHGYVSPVVSHLESTNTKQISVAHDRVVGVEYLGKDKVKVYNLCVDGTPEYFANSILVHNCAWDYPLESWNNLIFGMREGDPQIAIGTTPKPIAILRQIAAMPTTVLVTGSSYENAENLSVKYVTAVLDPLSGTTLGRREIEGLDTDDAEGALWKRLLITDNRVSPGLLSGPNAPELSLVAVGVDPQGKKGLQDDQHDRETGIVCVALCLDNGPWHGHYFVLEDASINGSPNEWGSAVVTCYKRNQADLVVAEINFGGEMVESTISVIDPNVPVKVVTASRGKVRRASPIVALYEKGKVHHVGMHTTLEDEQCNWVHKEGKNWSPNRMDALVWAITDLREAEMVMG